ncbi:MAG: hypothetical protein JWN46_3218, partial [Acidimicrobiales bacterium]|nr:hypothetical protein [Acidimicrobiales bacterium]
MGNCAACGVENPEGSRYCMGCGRSLFEPDALTVDAAGAAPADATEAPAPPATEVWSGADVASASGTPSAETTAVDHGSEPGAGAAADAPPPPPPPLPSAPPPPPP